MKKIIVNNSILFYGQKFFLLFCTFLSIIIDSIAISGTKHFSDDYFLVKAIYITTGFIIPTVILIYFAIYIFDYLIFCGNKYIKTVGFLKYTENYNRVKVNYSDIKDMEMKLIVTPWDKNTKKMNGRVTKLKLVDYYICLKLNDESIKEIYVNDFKLKNIELILNTIVERMKSCGNENYKNIDVKKIFEEFSKDPNCYLD